MQLILLKIATCLSRPRCLDVEFPLPPLRHIRASVRDEMTSLVAMETRCADSLVNCFFLDGLVVLSGIGVFPARGMDNKYECRVRSSGAVAFLEMSLVILKVLFNMSIVIKLAPILTTLCLFVYKFELPSPVERNDNVRSLLSSMVIFHLLMTCQFY